MKTNLFKTLFTLVIIALIASSCGNEKKDNDVVAIAVELPHGLILENMDTSVTQKMIFIIM